MVIVPHLYSRKELFCTNTGIPFPVDILPNEVPRSRLHSLKVSTSLLATTQHMEPGFDSQYYY